MNTLTLPNLLNNPDIRVSYTLGRQSYMFHFFWSDTFCLLDIYLIQDNMNIYICKGEPLIPGRNLLSRSAEITGTLVLSNKFGRNIAPSQENFATDFNFIYTPENEVNG